ncbi:HAD family phosphatase [Vibrio hannami]|uniref:HAD family hydrolase n=1 Tax=Vibrio hannami TaxID=2717094 RepID=UPI00240FFCD6|nr:HAD family phosphatase [Vibrio hannami]MDG3085751.1 HAD family phosphatase [Vibrio hannami]
MIKALLFDMDGLIFDTEGLYKIAWQKAAKDQDIELTDDLYRNFIGVQDPACEQLLIDWFSEQLDIERYRTVRDSYLAELKSGQPEYKAGFKPLFTEAKQKGLKLALVTSSFLKDVKHHFENSGFLEQFDVVITAEKVENGKPAPDCYIMACEAIDVEPQHCLVLEDSNNGMLAGLNAGCQAAMIPDLLPPNDEVKQRATYIVSSLRDIISVIES